MNAIITGIFTLLGVILGIWLERHFHEKATRKRLFNALFEEIELNILITKETQKTYRNPEWTIFDLSPLYTLGYQNIRASGELAILSRDTLVLLENTYEMIYAHNRQITTILRDTGILIRERGLKERIENLEKNLTKLKRNFLKELKFLKAKNQCQAPNW
ncbi:MAG: hypothetical protein HWN66_20495 [Candidatus Helarchaeota archaeon]|nr:hypothetical protein [Candidatus Helarchaeota archaeon]